uniref:Aquaporin 11 n=1 Tax=Oryzias sinensis TaxID=183150 RepID=A0A8C7WV39_9TELE
ASLLVIVGWCLFICRATLRRAGARVLAGAGWIYLLEAVSTFQLCCCTHELKLLGEVAQPEPVLGLTLTYMMTVVHVMTFREATCNPAAALEKLCRGTSSVKVAGRVVACQFGAALAARFFARSVWSLGLSDIHTRHQKFGFRCFDPLGGTVLEAAGAELACAFAFQAAVRHAHKVDEKLRVHVIAGVVTVAVYAGDNFSKSNSKNILGGCVNGSCL